MKISVIFTGGTIGSRDDGDFISLSENPYRLLRMYKARYDASDVEFEASAPFIILSENLEIGHVLRLAKSVREEIKKDCDAVIVTHGTDTIQYTASLLEWMCPDTDVPVFFVSANRVLDDERSNGIANFHGAVTAVRRGIKAGVYVSYQNPGEDLHIHRGIMLLPHAPFCEDLYSADDKIFATVKGDRLILREPDCTEQECRGISPLPVRGRIPHILMINIYPGMGEVFEGIGSGKNPDAVILVSYHSGTLPTEAEGFVRFCKAASRQDIPVYVCGTRSGHGYSSTKKFEELSLISVPSVSPIALYTKLVSLSLGES